MDAERYAQVREVFSEARRLSGSERDAWLDEACSGDESLKSEVLALLRFDELPTEAPDEAEDAPRPTLHELTPQEDPEAIGEYRIVRRIGAGGMGVVYEGIQESLDRRVAIKLIRPGLAGPEMLRRFAFEARALGRLRHPGIARIHEASTQETSAGPVPFFVMELVEGQPIDASVRERGLSIPERVALVARLADAVEHAHQRGIVHRDLKPGNVLVDADGQPRILDFGVSGSTDDAGRNDSRHTGPGQLLGTVQYMSPEQAAGDPDAVDTRADVFALGVIAYELLSGGLPHDLAELPLLDALQTVRDQPPIPLASRDPRLRGDLHTVVHKALARDKEQRYPTAAAFADDLRRILAHEPVAARPPSTLYQARRFARRHRVLVGGIFATVLALAGGLIATLHQASLTRDALGLAERRFEETDRARREAERRTEESETSHEFLERVVLAASPRYKGKDVTVIDALLWAAEESMPSFEGKPWIEAAVRTALGRTYSGLALYDRAEREYRLALARRRETLPADHPLVGEALLGLGATYLRLRRPEKAVPLLTEARGLYSGQDTRPTNLGTTLLSLAQHHTAQREFESAAPLFEEVLAVYAETRGREDRYYAIALNARGEMHRARTDYDAAAEDYEAAIRIMEGAGHLRSFNTAAMLNNLGLARRGQDRMEEAARAGRRALEIGREVFLDGDPRRAAFALNLSRHYVRLDRLDEALELANEALETWERGGPRGKQRIAPALIALGQIHLQRDEPGRAEPFLLRALTLNEKRHGGDHPMTRENVKMLSELRTAQGRHSEALELMRQARAIAEGTLPESSWVRADYDVRWSELLIDAQRADEAEALLVPAWRRLVEALGAEHSRAIRAWKAIERLYQKLGRTAELAALRAEST